MATCMLGYYDSTGKLSYHFFTASIATAVVPSVLSGVLPKTIRVPLQIMIGETFLLLSFIDVYCQIYLHSGISTSIFTTIFLTNIQESRDFLSLYFDWSLFLQWRISLLMILAVVFPISYFLPVAKISSKIACGTSLRSQRFVSLFMWLCLMTSLVVEIKPMYNFLQFFSTGCDAMNTESLIFRHYHEEIPLPLHRTLYAWVATKQSKGLLKDIAKTTYEVSVDSCSHLSPHIVLIIGESYNKHHSALYGYNLPTTPYQQKRCSEGSMIVFQDVVTPWNITSNVFLNIFSTWNSACHENIGDCPLFPALFRKAGYDVTFFSNQYVMRGFRKSSTNQAGFFFLANRELCDELFDFRNSKAYGLDMRAVHEFAEYKRHKTPAPYTLDIIHLIGQHFDYKSRYPREEGYFTLKDIKRNDLDNKARQVVMHYDNATRYNDKVVNAILSLYEGEEAVIVYVADHGEEVYGDVNVFGRLFQTPTWDIAHQEFEVPMWVWCSEKYIIRHENVVNAIKKSRHRPILTDDLPQLLFGLADLNSRWRDNSRNVLSDKYIPKKRIIAGEVDYDQLKKSAMSAGKGEESVHGAAPL